MKEDSRKRGRVRGGKKAVMRNKDGWASKERFLKAEDHGGIRGNELAKILSMGMKTTNIPLKNRHDQ